VTGAAASHAPVCVLVGAYGEPPWTVWLDLVFDSDVAIQWALLPSDATIEDGIVREFGEDSYPPADGAGGGGGERLVIAGLLRLAVNAMLLLADYGCRHLGPANPTQYRRLERYAGMARRRKRGVAEADRNLRLVTRLCGFPQDVVLHGEERESAGPGASPGEGDGGAEPHRRPHWRPHWRRGQWKTHAHGPGRAQRKRLFIRPVLVNGHLLKEGEQIPSTTYRQRPAG
jgi:hypothetical protein